MSLPTELVEHLAGHTCEEIVLGESGATVWRCTIAYGPTLFVKIAPLDADLQLANEAQRLAWMKMHHLPVPAVRDQGQTGDIEYLVVDEVPGAPAFAPQWTSARDEIVRVLGEGLAFLHQTNIADCPFDQRIAVQIARAQRRLAAGRVREDAFDAIRAGRSASDLFTELLASIPTSEDLVFGHGDFCLPNVVLQHTASGGVGVAGFVDCGRAGVADRHQDLALALRSIRYNFGEGWAQPFLDAYGFAHPDDAKLNFFTLLDEFF